MAKSGDELVNPVTGLRTVLRKTAQETSGELLLTERPDCTRGEAVAQVCRDARSGKESKLVAGSN